MQDKNQSATEMYHWEANSCGVRYLERQTQFSRAKERCRLKNWKKYSRMQDSHPSSPLIRAKETCFGVLDINGYPDLPVQELDCLIEITPAEGIRGGRRILKKRIKKLCQWIDSQQAETIAIVGHSEYFMVMLDLNYKFKNCDVWRLTCQQGTWLDLTLQHRLSEFRD